tara:strand:+ start:18106 stop:18330 length:225 start_codon:yes stop_codon:yes gene_type:complete
MSRFYGEVKGAAKTIASRRGFDGGIWSHTRGWHGGVKVVASVDSLGNDMFTIYKTGGSNNPHIKELLMEFVVKM